MPDISALSLTGARAEAVGAQTRLANSVLHLYQAGFTPSVTTSLADFLSHECDYDGYAALTIAAFSEIALAGAAYAIYAPTQTFHWTHVADDVGNQAGGAFLVLAGGALYSYTIFDPTRPIQGPDQVVVLTPTEVFAAG